MKTDKAVAADINTEKREYNSPKLVEYGDISDLTKFGGAAPGDGLGNPSTPEK